MDTNKKLKLLKNKVSKKQAVSDLWSIITKEAYLGPCQIPRETIHQIKFFWGEIYENLIQIFPPIPISATACLEDNKPELIHLVETKHIIERYRQKLVIEVWKACLKTVLLFVDSANFKGGRRYIKYYGPFKLYAWVRPSNALLQYKKILQSYLENEHNYLFYIKKIDFAIKQSVRNFYHHTQQVGRFHLSLLYLFYHFPVAVMATGKEVIITHPGVSLRNLLNKFSILKFHKLFQLYFTVSDLIEINSSRIKCLKAMENDSNLQDTNNVEIALSYYLNIFYRLTEVSNPVTMSMLISYLLSFWLETGSVILDLCFLTLGVNLSSYLLSRFLTQPLTASYSGGLTSVLKSFIIRHQIFQLFLTISSLIYIQLPLMICSQFLSIRYVYTIDLSFFITFEICFTQILGLREKVFSKFIEYHNDKIAKISFLQNKISLSKKTFNVSRHQAQAFAVFKLKEFESNLTKEMWLSELAAFLATHLTGNVVHIDLKKFQINFFLFESTSLINIIYFYSFYSMQKIWNKFQIHIKNLEIKAAEAKLLSRKLNQIFQKFIRVNSVCRFILKREGLQHTQAIVEFNFIGFNENLKKEIIRILELGSMVTILGYEDKSNLTLHLLPITKKISWAAVKFKEQIKALFPESRKPAPLINYNMIYLTEPQQVLYQTRYYPKKKSKKIKLESKDTRQNRFFLPSQPLIPPTSLINFQRYGIYSLNNRECGIRLFPDGGLPNVFVKLNADLDLKLASLGKKGKKILRWFRGKDDEKKDEPPVFERNYTECLPNGKVAFFKIKAGKEERLVSTSCVKLGSPCYSMVYTLFAFDHCEILHGLTTYRYKPKAEQIDQLSRLP